MKPITPSEVTAGKEATLPDEVISSFNEAISEYWNGTSSIVRQSYIQELIAFRLGISVNLVIENGYLDVEEIYRNAGWSVTYDKPAYNESYQATFEFRKAK